MDEVKCPFCKHPLELKYAEKGERSYHVYLNKDNDKIEYVADEFFPNHSEWEWYCIDCGKTLTTSMDIGETLFRAIMKKDYQKAREVLNEL